MPNLLADLPQSLPAELVDVLVRNEHVRIERIVSTGQASPPGFWYDQADAEWVLLLQGAARLVIEGIITPIELTAGDCRYIPAHQRHRVEWTGPNTPTVWLAVHFRE